jgi:NADH-quinone oxidoreductase subunit D
MEEMRQSVKILRQVIANMPVRARFAVNDPKNVAPPKTTGADEDGGVNPPLHPSYRRDRRASGEVYFGHENPKGELGFYISSKGGGTPHRLKIRAPSFVNLSILPKILPGHMMSDVVAILGSLDFVMGECDR